MSYIPHTDKEVEEMLEVIGVNSIAELFSDIKEDLRPKSFNLPEGKSELEVKTKLGALASKNELKINFVGGGAYDHYIPAAVEALASRSEFYTAYTPYQAECSQGILQAMFEFQTAICALTEMDVANASLYDGATALAEAVLMALRLKPDRTKVVIDGGLNPLYKRVLNTYMTNLPVELVYLPSEINPNPKAISSHLDENAAAVVIQNPNFFGTVADYTKVIKAAHETNALAIVVFYPLSLGLIKTPGEMDADIAVGEGQSLGLPLSFGGPYLGLMTCKREFVRKMPGRVIGETIDSQGQRAFVLTLQAREQHIRRQKATSNICTNAALCALRAVIFLSLLGKEGFQKLAWLNYQKAEFAKKAVQEIAGLEIENESTFNEFVVRLKGPAEGVVNHLLDKGIAAGIPLSKFYPEMGNLLLVAVTEKRSQEEIMQLVEGLKCA